MHATTHLLGGQHATFHMSIASEFCDEGCDGHTPLLGLFKTKVKYRKRLVKGELHSNSWNLTWDIYVFSLTETCFYTLSE